MKGKQEVKKRTNWSETLKERSRDREKEKGQNQRKTEATKG
jgi:hypothetical protein